MGVRRRAARARSAALVLARAADLECRVTLTLVFARFLVDTGHAGEVAAVLGPLGDALAERLAEGESAVHRALLGDVEAVLADAAARGAR